MGTAVLSFKNNAPSSTSAADDITLRMIVDRLRMAPLFGGFLCQLIGNGASCATACIISGQVRCIVMYYKYHTTGIERDDCLLLGCGIIEELFDPSHSVFGRGILFRGDVA